MEERKEFRTMYNIIVEPPLPPPPVSPPTPTLKQRDWEKVRVRIKGFPLHGKATTVEQILLYYCQFLGRLGGVTRKKVFSQSEKVGGGGVGKCHNITSVQFRIWMFNSNLYRWFNGILAYLYNENNVLHENF